VELVYHNDSFSMRCVILIVLFKLAYGAQILQVQYFVMVPKHKRGFGIVRSGFR
jgi:hypothetical protein